MRIVFDSNVLVRAFAWESGPANAALYAVLASAHTLILSSEILYEVSRVLRRPRIVKVHQRPEDEIYRYAEALRGSALFVPLQTSRAIPIRDAKDAAVIETALAGRATAICTRDRDFFAEPAAGFLEASGIELLTDLDLLRRLRQ